MREGRSQCNLVVKSLNPSSLKMQQTINIKYTAVIHQNYVNTKYDSFFL